MKLRSLLVLFCLLAAPAAPLRAQAPATNSTPPAASQPAPAPAATSVPAAGTTPDVAPTTAPGAPPATAPVGTAGASASSGAAPAPAASTTPDSGTPGKPMSATLSLGALPAGMPPPPALAIGDRLIREADAAEVEAERLKTAGDPIGAAFQLQIAQRRLLQAVWKYAEIPGSATYRGTPYAAWGMFLQGNAQERLSMMRPHRDPNPAIQIYKNLLAHPYADMEYPGKADLHSRLHGLQSLADYQNRTFTPEKYFYAIIDFFVRLTGAKSYSYFLALLFISIIVKAMMWPLSNKQYKSMKQMQKLQPLMKEIQTKYKSDPQKMQTKMMELYREHDAHPLKGCGPALISAPIFFYMYYMVRMYEFQFSHGTFLWIGSPLSHSHWNFLGLDLAPAANLSLMDVPLLILYGLTLFWQQKMLPLNPDPQQAETQKMMTWMAPLMSCYFFLQYRMPSAFVLYFLISNVFGMVQQYYQIKTWHIDPPSGPTNGSSGSESSSSDKRNRQASVDQKASSNGTGRGYDNDDDTGAERNGVGPHHGTKPAARGAIAPKVHAKKKKR